MPAEYNKRHILLRKEARGQDELVDKILNDPTGTEALLYTKAIILYESKVQKKYLESCLIASNNFERIAGLLEIPVELVKMYADVYYNLEGWGKLHKLELLERIRDQDEVILKTWGLNQGLDFIAWRLGRDKETNISPTEGLTELFNTCVYKSKEALFNPNSTNASIESTKWAKLSVEIARLLKVWTVDSSSAKKDLELAIKEVVPDFKSLDDLMTNEGIDVNLDDTGQTDIPSIGDLND